VDRKAGVVPEISDFTLGEDTTSPYSVPWNNVAAGSYTLTVKATDDRGAVTTSAAITLSVSNSPPVSVTLQNLTWFWEGLLFLVCEPSRSHLRGAIHRHVGNRSLATPDEFKRRRLNAFGHATKLVSFATDVSC
jgi:hypothetical protein